MMTLTLTFTLKGRSGVRTKMIMYYINFSAQLVIKQNFSFDSLAFLGALSTLNIALHFFRPKFCKPKVFGLDFLDHIFLNLILFNPFFFLPTIFLIQNCFDPNFFDLFWLWFFGSIQFVFQKSIGSLKFLTPKSFAQYFGSKKYTHKISFESKTILVQKYWGTENFFGPSRKILGALKMGVRNKFR